LDLFENLKDAIYSPFGFEMVHQISKRSVKWFKSYRDYKNSRWPQACGRHLGLSKNLKLRVIALVRPKLTTKF
jgi:hypothetical protein